MVKKKLQVFVSSTFTDLIVERQAAVAAILKAGHIPAGMELFTAGDKSQWKTIERWIDESDVYMLILGGRYGSVEPTTGVSYTELEYDYAAQQGKPLFAVVIKEEALEEKVRANGTKMVERENPQALRLFREKVLSNVSSFFGDEKDIRLCVYESLADLRDNASVKGWVSATDVEDAKSLHDEIARLREEIDRLQKGAAKSSKAVSEPTTDNAMERLVEVIELMNVTEVKIPETVAGKGNMKRTLLDLLYANQNSLINGVTNAVGVREVESFLYHNVVPKLMVHGLADNEKVAGARYRRSCLNSHGIAVLAELERMTKKKMLEDAKGNPSK